MRQITVLIVDDNLVIRRGLRSLLASEPDISVVGEVSTGGEAIDWATTSSADVILMDIRMPGIHGIKATAEIVRMNPDAKVLIVTALEDPINLARAVKSGARGCLVYSHFLPDEFIQAIRAVASGGQLIVSPSVAMALVDLNQKRAAHKEQGQSSPDPLTEREEQVLTLMAKGKNNDEIAKTLCISQKTVKNHINRIYAKLSVKSRYQAIRFRLGGVATDDSDCDVSSSA